LRATFVAAIALAGGLACIPEAPENPTWANVQPILAGQCTHCHGANADRLGAERTGGGLRFDFYDMKVDDDMPMGVCGEATSVLGAGKNLAFDHAGDIWESITTTDDLPNARPAMPPPPAPYLADWEWRTLQRWVDGGAMKGELPPSNRPPRFRLYHDSGPADQTLDITAVIEDPDGDPIVGVLMFGDARLNMDRGGAYSATLDTSSWPAGERPITAVLCDGWSNVTYAVGTLTVNHPP
jgi:hypothetical protein